MMPWERCKNLLSRFIYKDLVTVSRQVPAAREDGSDGYEIQDVYTDLPCKLSQYGKELESRQNAREFFIKTDLRICLDPQYEILPNDILTITHEGRTFQLNAARSFPYPDHQEISVRREDEA